jgi:hypothetical protein
VASLRITDGFKEDLLMVESDRVLEEILHVVEMLQTVPTLGSRDLPASIRHSLGNCARKIPVGAFDLVTIYDESAEIVTVAGLIHQRAAW